MTQVPATLSVPVLEVFSSFQGEGPRVGERQVFVRLAKCDLRCAFCDTPESYPTPEYARIEVHPLRGQDERPQNPVQVRHLIEAIGRLDEPRGLHTALSITGGEPLLHPAAVHALALGGSALGLAVHVETGGHRPGAVRHVLDVVDWFTPDLKLESSTGAPTPWAAHEETYAMLEEARKALAVKAVIGGITPLEEVEAAARFCQLHVPSAPFVLLPATPYRQGPAAPTRGQLYRMHEVAARHHPDVRVIPQVHRALGLR